MTLFWPGRPEEKSICGHGKIGLFLEIFFLVTRAMPQTKLLLLACSLWILICGSVECGAGTVILQWWLESERSSLRQTRNSPLLICWNSQPWNFCYFHFINKLLLLESFLSQYSLPWNQSSPTDTNLILGR